jgi:hypothetical protein
MPVYLPRMPVGTMNERRKIRGIEVVGVGAILIIESANNMANELNPDPKHKRRVIRVGADHQHLTMLLPVNLYG